ncbi:hypothetical protein IFM51744_09075 [Aspergillus udagawae]|nr:hypothetical protein IFM51744_09075 [Aspergillus udagawae]
MFLGQADLTLVALATTRREGRFAAPTRSVRPLDILCKDLNENNENNSGEDIHLGFLFRLPEYVTDRYLRKDIPLEGSKRTARVRRIRSDCIRTSTEYNDLDDTANKIFKSLWKPIQISMNCERFIHEGPTDVPIAESRYENVIRDPPMAHGPSNDAVSMDKSGAQEWLPALSQQTQSNTDMTFNSSNPAEGPLRPRQAASQVSGQSGVSEVVILSRGMRSQEQVHPPAPRDLAYEGSYQNGGSQHIHSETRTSLNEENVTLPSMSNQSDPSQAGMRSGDFNLQPHSTYMPVPGPHDMSDPAQLRITGNLPFQQVHTTSARSNTHSDQSQMNITFDRFNPQPYLTYTPAPRPRDMSDSTQLGVTENLPFQQAHTTSARSNTHSDQSQMNITFDRFNPQPYLTYTPAPRPPDMSDSTQLGVTGNLPFQQVHMTSAHTDTQPDQSQMNITFDRFNPQPYLTYTPTPRPPDMSDSTQLGVTGNLPFQQSQMNITFDRFNPQPYLTYMPAAQPSAPLGHQKPAIPSGAYMELNQQSEDFRDGQAEPNGYQNEVQRRPQDMRVWNATVFNRGWRGQNTDDVNYFRNLTFYNIGDLRASASGKWWIELLYRDRTAENDSAPTISRNVALDDLPIKYAGYGYKMDGVAFVEANIIYQNLEFKKDLPYLAVKGRPDFKGFDMTWY